MNKDTTIPEAFPDIIHSGSLPVNLSLMKQYAVCSDNTGISGKYISLESHNTTCFLPYEFYKRVSGLFHSISDPCHGK